MHCTCRGVRLSLVASLARRGLPPAVPTTHCQLCGWRPCAPHWVLALAIDSGLLSPGPGPHKFRCARAVARCFTQVAQAQPPTIMRSMLVLCLALCVLGPCSGFSLRAERDGLSRGGYVGNKAFMLISGKSGPQEMCLVIADGARFVAWGGRPNTSRGVVDHLRGVAGDAGLALESCVDAVAAGDGRELWVMQPEGRIAALRGEKCVSEHDGLVSLSDCEASVAWELQANNKLKSGSGGRLCLSGSGASSGSNVALRAAVHASSAIDVAHGSQHCY